MHTHSSIFVEIFDFGYYICLQINDIFIGFRCNIDLKATQTVQSFSSPGYPDAYQNHVNCIWTISSVSGYLIVVKLFNFNTEHNYDFVSVMFLFSIVCFCIEHTYTLDEIVDFDAALNMINNTAIIS